MKILLLGEYSSLHRYLKEGLCAHGHEVHLIADGDGWKKIGGMDETFPQRNGNSLGEKIRWLKKYTEFIDSLGEYDVIQLMSTTIINRLVFFRCIRKLRSKCKCLSLVSAGGSHALSQKYREGFFDWYVYDYDKYPLKNFDYWSVNGMINNINGWIAESLVDVIIPSLYEYQIPFANSSKCWNVIPFPINVDDIKYQPNVVTNKIMIYHGLNREKAKGTPIIRKAMEKLKKHYSSEVEILIKGRMPFDEYLNVMSKTNILIDQCCGYGYGINACIGMAQGKVVMTPIREETLSAFGLSSSPIVNVKPDADYIYNQLEKLICDKESFSKRGLESRKYVENLHDYKKNALKYVEAWKAAM